MEGNAVVKKAAVVTEDSSLAKNANTESATATEDEDSDVDAEELADAAEAESAATSFLQLSSPRTAIASALQLRGAPGDKADARTRVLTLLRQRSEELDSPVP